MIKLDPDESRFINTRRLVTEHIPPVMRQLFRHRWDARFPSDAWDDTEGDPRAASGRKLLEGNITDTIRVPCVVELKKAWIDEKRKERGAADPVPTLVGKIAIISDDDPALRVNLHRYEKRGGALHVVDSATAAAFLPSDTKVDKFDSDRQLVVTSTTVPDIVPAPREGLWLRVPRVLPPANLKDVSNDDAKKRSMGKALRPGT